MTARDLNEEGRAQGLFPQTLAIHDQHKGYPELDEDMVAFAKAGGGLQTLAQEYHAFLDAYAAAPDIMRFRISGYNTYRIGVVLDGLPYPERHFNAQPDFLRQCKMFITQDEIDQFFLRDSVDRRLAVYSHFCYPHTPEERQKFIKGSFGEYSGGARAGYGYTKTYKGLEYERDYNFKKYDTVHLTIPNVVKDEETLFSELTGVVFLNPDYAEGVNEKYLPADEYLSGNVRQKLAVAQGKAEQDPQYQINADALAQVQPTDLTASEISVRLGATWLDTEYVRRFIFETLGTPRGAQWSMKVHYSGITGEWRIEGKSTDRGNVKAISTYGTKRINAYEIIEDTLNLKDVRIFDYV